MFQLKISHRPATMKAVAGKACLSLALVAAFGSPAWAERLEPARSVVGDREDIKVSISFPQAKTGDLYIAADAGGTFLFLNERNQWVTTPVPYEFGQPYSGIKPIILGNTSGIGMGIYPVYQVIAYPNTPDIYDTRNWVGGFGGLGLTSFQVKLPAEISGDRNADGWADDDANRDGFHDDDSNRDGIHDDDSNRDGFHDDDANRDGIHDDDANRDGFHDDDLNRDGFHDDDLNRDGSHDDKSSRDGSHDGKSSQEDK